MTPLWLALVTHAARNRRLLLCSSSGYVATRVDLEPSQVQQVAQFLPVAMLSALVAVELFDGGGRYLVDWRTQAGVAAAVVVLLLRRGFLVVFLVAIAVTALLRLAT